MIRRNLFSIITALIILYLSMANSDTFDEVPLFNIPHFDKIVHFLMYFGLMSVIIFENRHLIKTVTTLLFVSAIPALYGLIMEILQLFTATRSGDFADFAADLCGVAFSALLWLIFKPVITRRSDNY